MKNLNFIEKFQPSITPSEFADKLTSKFLKREGLFTNTKNIEDYIPKNITPIEQANWTFYTVQLDYAMKGQILYQGSIILHQQTPQFFTPNYILNQTDQQLFQIITTYFKPRYPNEAVIRFQQNSHLLQQKYENNPLNIFSETNSATNIIKKIREFRGMGPKIGNLFFRAMTSHFKLEFPDLDDILQPVDVHDIRIARFLGFSSVPENNPTETDIDSIKKLWQEACQKAKVDWISFDRALWLLGSEGKPKTKEDIIKLID